MRSKLKLKPRLLNKCAVQIFPRFFSSYEHLLLEKYEDPLKKGFDTRMHKIHGSIEATKLKPHTFSQPNVCVVLECLSSSIFISNSNPSDFICEIL